MNDIRVIHATNGGFCIVDADMFHELNQHEWSRDKKGYFRRKFCNAMLLIHKLVNGTPDGFETDHRNGYKQDNTARNLRTATQGQNNCNRKKQAGDYHSKYKGVTYMKSPRYILKRWVARINIGHKKTASLGYFKTEQEAALAYNQAATKHHGEFARLNTI